MNPFKAAAIFTFFYAASAMDVTLSLTTYLDDTNPWKIQNIDTNNVCYNVKAGWNDNIHSFITSEYDGNCVFWKNYNCQGDHTNQLSSTADFAYNCKASSKWHNNISSFKCCDKTAWSGCVPGAAVPTCKPRP